MSKCDLQPDGDAFRCSVCGQPARMRQTIRTCQRSVKGMPRELPPREPRVVAESQPFGYWDCAHRSEAPIETDGKVKRVKCGCPSGAKLPIFQCALLGQECSPFVDVPSLNPGVTSCLKCEVSEPREGKTDWRHAARERRRARRDQR